MRGPNFWGTSKDFLRVLCCVYRPPHKVMGKILPFCRVSLKIFPSLYLDKGCLFCGDFCCLSSKFFLLHKVMGITWAFFRLPPPKNIPLLGNGNLKPEIGELWKLLFHKVMGIGKTKNGGLLKKFFFPLYLDKGCSFCRVVSLVIVKKLS